MGEPGGAWAKESVVQFRQTLLVTGELANYDFSPTWSDVKALVFPRVPGGPQILVQCHHSPRWSRAARVQPVGRQRPCHRRVLLRHPQEVVPHSRRRRVPSVVSSFGSRRHALHFLGERQPSRSGAGPAYCPRKLRSPRPDPFPGRTRSPWGACDPGEEAPSAQAGPNRRPTLPQLRGLCK